MLRTVIHNEDGAGDSGDVESVQTGVERLLVGKLPMMHVSLLVVRREKIVIINNRKRYIVC